MPNMLRNVNHVERFSLPIVPLSELRMQLGPQSEEHLQAAELSRISLTAVNTAGRLTVIVL